LLSPVLQKSYFI